MKNSHRKVKIIGAGLAGCEAAWFLAERDIEVDLFEMRPDYSTSAHKTGDLAELVCSNSLKSDYINNASGLLKAELRRFGSFLLKIADECRIPGGKALVVDRIEFSKKVTSMIESHPGINLIREEFKKFEDDNVPLLIASGPLTSYALSNLMCGLLGREFLHFYDAISPIIDGDSIDMKKCFYSDRYGKGSGDYLNCPMNGEEFERFYNELLSADRIDNREFEEKKYFERCLPVEEIARRGHDALRFGPMRPVGIKGPSGEHYYAIVQLRKENMASSSYNIVGFQTRLRHKDQERVLSAIPGLENLKILRYGSIHRNSFINSPAVLDRFLSLRDNPLVSFAGQLSGSEGYVEAIATGLFSAINICSKLSGKEMIEFPRETAIGSLVRYLTDSANADSFQPMNFNFGLLPQPAGKMRKSERIEIKTKTALTLIDKICKNYIN